MRTVGTQARELVKRVLDALFDPDDRQRGEIGITNRRQNRIGLFVAVIQRVGGGAGIQRGTETGAAGRSATGECNGRVTGALQSRPGAISEGRLRGPSERSRRFRIQPKLNDRLAIDSADANFN